MLPMFAHQNAAVRFLMTNNFSGCLFMDIGTGKTRTGIEAFRVARSVEPKVVLLVICPLSLIESAWGEDLKKFAPELSYTNCHERIINLSADIFLINYEACITKRGSEILQQIIEKHQIFCILDESSKIKNHSSAITKTLLKLQSSFAARVCMSATPAPNSELEYWAQVEFVRPGALHMSFHGFKNTYFHLSRGKQILPQGVILGKAEYAKIFSQGWKYALTEQKRKMLLERIAAVSFRCDKDECLDLPDTIDEVRKVEMGPAQRKHYNQMKNELITQIKDEAIVAQVALAKIMKLRQICSGFAITPEGVAMSIGENPKMKELLVVLEEAGPRPIIIWAQFHHEIELICQTLGDSARALYSPTEDKDATIQGFKDSKFQYLVAHPRSAGHGHTFVNSNLELFYSLSYSWEEYEQSRGRVHRVGQKQKVTYIHLLCRDSIEEIMLDVLRRKADAVEVLYEVMNEAN